MLISEVAPKLKPGQQKDLKIQIKDMTDLLDKVKTFEHQIDKAGTFGPEFKKETDVLKAAIKKKIAELHAQIEKETPTAAAEFIKFWNKTLAPNCSEILQVYKTSKLVLFRGTYRDDSAAFVGRSLENREPVDSSRVAQQLYDTALKELGITALRSNSIFTSANYDQATSYGSPYVIFPINGFAFSYTKIRDLVLDSPDSVIDPAVISTIGKIILKNKLDPSDFDLYKHWSGKKFEIDGYDFQLAEFLSKLKTHKVLGKDPFIKSLTPVSLVNVAKFKKKYDPSNTNLSKALKAKVEVCISGTYYALSVEKYGRLIEAQLGFKLKTGEH